MDDFWRLQQEDVCRRFSISSVPCPPHSKVGIALNVRSKLLPINGLRLKAEGDTTGWYIWAGSEISQDPDFFLPLHVEHLIEWCPLVIPYLLLPIGWRFQIAPDYEDVWFDEELARFESTDGAK